MASRYGPHGPISLPAASYDIAALNALLSDALAKPDAERDAAVDAAILQARDPFTTPALDFSDPRNSQYL